MKGFKDFIMRGNLIELAVAFIMGAVFNTVVKTFTDVIMGFISKIIGTGPNFDSVTIVGVAVGPFLSAAVNFLLVALVVYFLIVKPVNIWRDRTAKKEEETTDPTELEVLTEIRDLLKKD
ncbi:MAG: large conductance mechanosensitive channel protein MscL [Propionibacteriaceae bacterium]|jgi:large conductance mechanosensitive channel|nr:large conductance mechanosensitive channel protein MscL [Propionibacteriaceae bacterium]